MDMLKTVIYNGKQCTPRKEMSFVEAQEECENIIALGMAETIQIISTQDNILDYEA